MFLGDYKSLLLPFELLMTGKATENEIYDMCFSTYVSIKLQKMSKGDVVDILDCYKDEILSKDPKLND